MPDRIDLPTDAELELTQRTLQRILEHSEEHEPSAVNYHATLRAVIEEMPADQDAMIEDEQHDHDH